MNLQWLVHNGLRCLYYSRVFILSNVLAWFSFRAKLDRQLLLHSKVAQFGLNLFRGKQKVRLNLCRLTQDLLLKESLRLFLLINLDLFLVFFFDMVENFHWVDAAEYTILAAGKISLLKALIIFHDLLKVCITLLEVLYVL